MIGVTDLKSGTIFEENGNLLQVLSYEHIKMGRGSANIKLKVKNVRTGSTTDKSFINGAKVNNVTVLKKDLQFLYKDSDNAYFMNPHNYEQTSVSLKVIGDDVFYLKEGENINVSFLGEEALSLNLPPKMVFEVLDTPPGVKGNSATNVFKDAELENGLSVKVPLFIKTGDKIRVDTRTGSYTEKAS
jgi:elongation factor P